MLAELHCTMTRAHDRPRADFVRIATEAMSERGLEPAFPAAVEQQLACKLVATNVERGFIDFVLVE